VCCTSIGGAICRMLYQHWRCDMLCAVSALEVRYVVCCISLGGAICCMLYQHWRCDILCSVSALEVRYAVCCISIGGAAYCAVCQHSRCDRFCCLSLWAVTFSCCLCSGSAACSVLRIGSDTCPVLGAVHAAISDVCMRNHSDYELLCSVITYRATSTYS
jgi:hypothetical protein